MRLNRGHPGQSSASAAVLPQQHAFAASTHSGRSESSLSYAGWPVVLAAFFGVMVGFGGMVPYTFSLFLAPLHAAFGWKTEAISIGFGIAALSLAFSSPVIGRLLDRGSPRKVILPAIILFSLGMASLARLGPHIARFYLSYLLLGIVGNATAQLAYSRAVSTWFVSKRGLAFSLMLTGGGVGAVLLPILTQRAIDLYGWRTAYLVLGGIALLFGLPLAALFVRERPCSDPSIPEPSKIGLSLKEAARGRTLWIMLPSVLIYAISANGVLAHLSGILVGAGLTAHTAAFALSILGASGIAGRLVTGHLLDRFFAPRVSIFMLLLCCLGILLLAQAQSTSAAIVASAMLGFGLGSEIDVTPYLIARYCGLKNFSTFYGLSWTAYAIGAAAGPVLFGRAHDLAGAYQRGSITLFAIPCLASAALLALLPSYPVPGKLQVPDAAVTMPFELA